MPGQWADPRIPTQACTGALAKCRATYLPDNPRPRRRLARPVLDARHGVLYRH
ncbi:MAG TPA: hypothetical protein VHY21_22685 [Pseudonocardiaceae bacterium]|nr:hypothetical protein [Pseudonocardiaceae bacterium]